DRVEIQSRMIIYQEYQAWCEANGEKPFSNNILGKKFTHINIENKRAGGGKRVWQYILDQSKIVAKLRESIGVIEEFSDAPQPEILANKSTDIPMFYVPEIKSPEPEKNIAETLTTDCIEKGKDLSPVPIPAVTNMTQDLFDYITGQSEYSVASLSKTTDIFMTPEIEYVEPVDNKSEPSSKIIKEPEIRGYASSVNDKPETNNEEASTQSKTYLPGYIPRAERKVRLRETAIKYGEDPDKFMTITKEDRDLVKIFQDKMMADMDIIDFARKDGDDPEEYIELSRREKLICMEIKLRMYEDDDEFRSYTCIYDGEE
ncbi:9123_t:CDS:1, partial [Scutellospora calospora]